MSHPVGPVLAALDAVYARLPALRCRGLCQTSCYSRIDASTAEQQRVLERGVDLNATANGRPCPALTRTALGAARCSVHDVRPMICRIWGIAAVMPCPHGCRPDGGLVDDATALSWVLDALDAGGGHAGTHTALVRQLVAASAADPTASRLLGRYLRGDRSPSTTTALQQRIRDLA